MTGNGLAIFRSGVGEALARAQELNEALAGLPHVELIHHPADPPETFRFRSTQALPGWIASGLVAVAGQSLTVRELHLVPAGDGTPGLTRKALASLSPEQLTDVIRKRLSLLAEIDKLKETVGFAPYGDLRAAASASGTLRGQPSLPDGYFEHLAEAYLAEAPGGRGLYERMAARLGLTLDDRARRALRNHLHLARNRGWLERTAGGDVAGEKLHAARKGRAAHPTEGKDA